MDISKIGTAILDNADRVTSFVLLICISLVLGYLVYGFLTGKFASVTDYKRLAESVKTCQDDTKKYSDTLAAARSELSESRSIYSAASVRIEFLERDNRAKETEITDLRRRVSSLESELHTLRYGATERRG